MRKINKMSGDFFIIIWASPRSLVLIQTCNRHAIRANVNKTSDVNRLVQKLAGKKALLAGYLIPLLHMSSQRTIFLLGKDKLINLELTVFLSYLETGQFFRNLKVNLSRIIDFYNIFALSCREPKKMSSKIP